MTKYVIIDHNEDFEKPTLLAVPIPNADPSKRRMVFDSHEQAEQALNGFLNELICNVYCIDPEDITDDIREDFFDMNPTDEIYTITELETEIFDM